MRVSPWLRFRSRCRNQCALKNSKSDAQTTSLVQTGGPQELPSRQLRTPRAPPWNQERGQAPTQAPAPDRRQAQTQQASPPCSGRTSEKGTRLRSTPRPRNASTDPRDTARSLAQDGSRREPPPHSMMASARGTAAKPGKNVAAKRKLNESLAESAIGHIGKLLREEAAKLGIPTVSVPPHGTSQTCPRCGDRHPNNRESQAVFRCRHCDLYAHADWTAAIIIRNRAYVRHCEWQTGHTPDVLTAPTGWREQPSGSEPRQPRLGLELSVFKPEGTATSSHGNRVRGPRPARRIQSGGPRRQKC